MADMSIVEAPPRVEQGPDNYRIGNIIIPDAALVREVTDPSLISCGVAVSERDKKARLDILTQRYLQVGYIKPDDPRIVDGVYRDEWEESAIPIVAKVGDRVLASLRLIPNSPTHPLPVNSSEIEIDPDWQDKIAHVPFEISQLAKPADVTDHDPTLGILRAYIAVSRSQGQNEAAAVIDNKVRRMLNGNLMRFNLPQVGPAVNYMGSESIPTYINIRMSLNNTALGPERSKRVAQFLDTGQAPGFEWYVGL